MARTFTLAELIADVRARTDLQHDTGFVSDDELTRYLNQSIAEWYELVVSARGEQYFQKCATLTVSPCGTATLPADFYKLVGVDIEHGGRWISLRPLPLAERTRYMNDRSAAYPSRYQVMAGRKLALLPAPRRQMQCTVLYLPTAPALSLDSPSATFDGVSGWEEYAVVDACIKVLQKGDRDVRVLLAQKADMRRRIEEMAQDRHAEPSRIQDVTRGRFYDDDGWGWV